MVQARASSGSAFQLCRELDDLRLGDFEAAPIRWMRTRMKCIEHPSAGCSRCDRWNATGLCAWPMGVNDRRGAEDAEGAEERGEGAFRFASFMTQTGPDSRFTALRRKIVIEHVDSFHLVGKRAPSHADVRPELPLGPR
jgi:hypothetical protein